MLRYIICAIVLCQASSPPKDFSRQFKDARDFMLGVAEKMPAWDVDKLGQYERTEIAIVKFDIVVASQDTDPDDFLIDIQQLRNDVEILQALDDSLNKNKVI